MFETTECESFMFGLYEEQPTAFYSNHSNNLQVNVTIMS